MTLSLSFIQVIGPVYLLSNSYNSLTEVEGSEFRSLRQLEMLMLHGNDINTVHPGAFYSLRSLQVRLCLCLCVFLDILQPFSTSGQGTAKVLIFCIKNPKMKVYTYKTK